MDCWILFVVFIVVFGIWLCCWIFKGNLLEYVLVRWFLNSGIKFWRFFWIFVFVLIGFLFFLKFNCLFIKELVNVWIIFCFVLSLGLLVLCCCVLFVVCFLGFFVWLVGCFFLVWFLFLILFILFFWVFVIGMCDFLNVLVFILCINIFLWGIFLYVVMWCICEV